MLFNLSAGDNTSEEVQAILSSFMDEMESVVNTLKTDVGNQLATFKSEVGSQITTLTSAVNGVPKGAVKSVQRGVHGGSSDTSNITININSVNPNKCLVLLSQHRNSWTYANDYRPQLVAITATSITVSPSGTYSDGVMSASSFSWQVIEFY